MSRSDLVDIEVVLKHETDKAWLVNEGDFDAWIPKSRGELEKNPAPSRTWTLTIPQGLAEEKGLV